MSALTLTGSGNADTITGALAIANSITGGAGADTIALNGATTATNVVDTVVLSAPATIDTVTGFRAGDILQFSLAGFTGANALFTHTGTTVVSVAVAAAAAVTPLAYATGMFAGTAAFGMINMGATTYSLTTLQTALRLITGTIATPATEAFLVEYVDSTDLSVHIAAAALGTTAANFAAAVPTDIAILTGVTTTATVGTNIAFIS